ncbi:hypothetical protein KC19_VG098200 [Ceratodon purpureus]|uniref:Uncharacterized protein n=1 Tax=Ceratodon purpureus TaxID=3225 RepID=A0A8T0HNY7_CERPU|nr:hypothetical protein KC19_VG098200 [Ceratodon purpureus]
MPGGLLKHETNILKPKLKKKEKIPKATSSPRLQQQPHPSEHHVTTKTHKHGQIEQFQIQGERLLGELSPQTNLFFLKGNNHQGNEQPTAGAAGRIQVTIT